jgi:hypothetical protein
MKSGRPANEAKMTKLSCYGRAVRVRGVLSALAFLFCFTAAAVAADTITGTATNRSRGQGAAGDDVILLALDKGMIEESRTKTDPEGAFTIKVQAPDKPHLVRVVHQGVNYDKPAAPGERVTIEVFDTAAKVQGVTGGVEIMRTGTKGDGLHVTDMIEIRNESQPPVTQAGERTFDIYLPAKAKIDTVLAAGDGKLAVFIAASRVPGEPGHYTINFPLRPGSSKFAFNYDLPYDGHAAFRPRLAYPMKQLYVMIPQTMKFTSSSPAYQPVNTGNNDFKVQAAIQLGAGEAPGFEISGAGAIPALQARSQPQPGATAAPNPGHAPLPTQAPSVNGSVPPTQAPAANNLRGAAPAPGATSAPASTREWWILVGAAVLVIGSCAFMIWRMRRYSSSGAETKTSPAGPSATLLEALKQDLLELETSRVQGSISAEEYVKAKQALDGTVQRALARAAAKS